MHIVGMHPCPGARLDVMEELKDKVARIYGGYGLQMAHVLNIDQLVNRTYNGLV